MLPVIAVLKVSVNTSTPITFLIPTVGPNNWLYRCFLGVVKISSNCVCLFLCYQNVV